MSARAATAALLCFLAASAAWPACAQAPPTMEEMQALRSELERLRAEDRERATRMDAIEQRLNAMLGASDPAAPALLATNAAEASAAPEAAAAPQESDRAFYEPLRGVVLASGDLGEVDMSLTTYARYLNQLGLDDTFTDSFGRTFTLDLRQDIQLNKVNLTFKGWMFDPRFRYLIFAWTSNANQGLGAQVVLAGWLGYRFNDRIMLAGGIGALPTTRSTQYTYPHWLRVDNRPMADEFFRGSYTSGVWAQGEIIDGLEYRVMLGNNLSTLGVDAGQLDDELNTLSAGFWWMPTTHEFGFVNGFGDFEYHEELATMFNASFTTSREDAESQAGVNDFENSQIRLSDGTRIFQPDAFATGGQITGATYTMFTLGAGFKYRGWSLEGEYYWRWVDDFDTVGFIPVTELYDHGFQLQASTMAIRDRLQLYASGSMIFGEFGDPSDIALGLNVFPFRRRELRLNMQALYVDRSPVGYTSIPYQVGGDGWIFTTDFALGF
jgi:hypothetical protein